MNVEYVKAQFFDKGFVALNTGTVNTDFNTIEQISNMFEKTLIVGKHHIENNRRIQIVSEKEMFGGEYLHWHTDQSYGIGNYNGTLLAYGSADHETHTEFADMVAAYEALPESEKQYYDTITCTYGAPAQYRHHIDKAQQRLLKDTPNKPGTRAWPLVTSHPITGVKSLYFSPLTFVESNKQFDEEKLLRHCEKFSFKHHWKPGDIILWDNRLVIHRRMAFKGHRELFRVSFKYE